MSFQKSILIFWLLPREIRNRFSPIHCMQISHLNGQGRSYCNYHFIDEQQCRGINGSLLQEKYICFSLWSLIQWTYVTFDKLQWSWDEELSFYPTYQKPSITWKKRKHEPVLPIFYRSALITKLWDVWEKYRFHIFLLYILHVGEVNKVFL